MFIVVFILHQIIIILNNIIEVAYSKLAYFLTMSENLSLGLFSRKLNDDSKQLANARILKSSAGIVTMAYFGMLVMVLTHGGKADELALNF